jgi:steroid delta-isomerase-like uncharacterized protein
MNSCSKERAHRAAAVDEHVRRENLHDIDGVAEMYGDSADFYDAAWNVHHIGRDAIFSYYEELIRGLPDLRFDVLRRHVSDDSIVIEGIASGHHLGPWRGLPSTGYRISVPMCAVFTFEGDGRFAGETIFYDRATVLRQLAMFHEPDTLLGRATAALAHPVALARIAGRLMVRRSRDGERNAPSASSAGRRSDGHRR